MRIAALILTVVAAFVCLWFFAVGEGLIRPGADPVMQDTYYTVAHVRADLPYAMLALMGGILTLALWQRPRRLGLWLVLAGGFLAIAVSVCDYFYLAAPPTGRIPSHILDASGGDADNPFEAMMFWLNLRRWLLWTALGGTLAGWAAWLAGRLRPAETGTPFD